MEEIKGRLESLGSSTIFNHRINVYNTFEIGGEILQKISVARSMNDMLQDAVGDEITLFLQGKEIVGMQRSNGKSYAMKEEHRPGILGWIFSIVLIPLYGIGLVLVYAKYWSGCKARERDKIREKLPTATLLEY